MPNSKPKRWKKITNGLHVHTSGQRIKKDEILVCKESELSDVIKSHFICLDTPEKEDVGSVLKVVKTEDGKFNVVNTTTKKAINENPLTKERAEELSGVEYVPSEDDEITDDDLEEEEEEEEEVKTKPKMKSRAKKEK